MFHSAVALDVHVPQAASAKEKAKATETATPAPKQRAKLTYPKAVVQVVKAHGLLSRAAVSKEVKALGLDKDAQLKTAIKTLVNQGTLALDGASYKLGVAARAELKTSEAEAYEAALEHAVGSREEKAAEKEAGRMRADAQAIRNIKAACR